MYVFPYLLSTSGVDRAGRIQTSGLQTVIHLWVPRPKIDLKCRQIFKERSKDAYIVQCKIYASAEENAEENATKNTTSSSACSINTLDNGRHVAPPGQAHEGTRCDQQCK